MKGKDDRFLLDSEREVADILGYDRTFGLYEVNGPWGILPDSGVSHDPMIHYSKEVIAECAEANAEGSANWCLFCTFGLQLSWQLAARGFYSHDPAYFDERWTNIRDLPYLKEHPPIKVSYQLLDFTNRFHGLSWYEQGDHIAELGPGYTRASDEVVSEAYFSAILVSNRTIKLIDDWAHWGHFNPLADAGEVWRPEKLIDSRLTIGCFPGQPLHICPHYTGYANSKIGVVLARKPDLSFD